MIDWTGCAVCGLPVVRDAVHEWPYGVWTHDDCLLQNLEDRCVRVVLPGGRFMWVRPVPTRPAHGEGGRVMGFYCEECGDVWGDDDCCDGCGLCPSCCECDGLADDFEAHDGEGRGE